MTGNPLDPKEGLSRLFREESQDRSKATSPFGDTSGDTDPASRLRASIVRLRLVRGQAGSDGLTPSATRSLLDELLHALEAIEEALPAGDASHAIGSDDG